MMMIIIIIINVLLTINTHINLLRVDESLLNESYADIFLFYTNGMDNVLSSQASNRLVRQ